MPLVKCPQCCQCYHETTERFNPLVNANGLMVRLREPWRSWGWTPFGGQDGRDISYAETEATLASDMTCPDCGSQLAPSGRLTVIDGEKHNKEEQKKEDAVCDIVEQIVEAPKTKKEIVASLIAEGKTWREMLKETGMMAKELSETIKSISCLDGSRK